MNDAGEQELPAGWAWGAVGDLAEYRNGAAFRPIDWGADGIPIIRIQNLTDPSRQPNRTNRIVDSRLLIRNGDLLFSWSATLDAFLWHGEDSWLNQHIFKVDPESGVSKSFLYYLLRHVAREIVRSEHIHGSTMQHINRGPFLGHRVALPPAAEQVRIADVLDEVFSELDAGVAALERVRAKLKLYRASVLKAAVEGTLTTEWRAQHPDVEPASELLGRVLVERRQRWEEEQLARFKEKGTRPPKNWKSKYKDPIAPGTTNLLPLPKGWCWTSLDALIVNGPQNGLYLHSSAYGRGVPILRIDDFQNGWIRPRSELNRVDANPVLVRSYALERDDLVINRVNSMTHLGKCVGIATEFAGVLFESNMMRARLSSAIMTKFIEYYLHSATGRQHLTRDAKWAVNQASINQQDVKSTVVLLPPAAEQEAIVEAVENQLSVLDHLEADLNAKLKAAQALRRSILHAAFTGKLVPQDPNDEPASELLKRIAAERERRVEEAAAAKRAARKPTGSGTRRGRPRKNATTR